MENLEVVGIEPKLTREEELEKQLIVTTRTLMRERIVAAQQSLVLLDQRETQLADRVKARAASSGQIVPLSKGTVGQ